MGLCVPRILSPSSRAELASIGSNAARELGEETKTFREPHTAGSPRKLNDPGHCESVISKTRRVQCPFLSWRWPDLESTAIQNGAMGTRIWQTFPEEFVTQNKRRCGISPQLWNWEQSGQKIAAREILKPAGHFLCHSSDADSNGQRLNAARSDRPIGSSTAKRVRGRLATSVRTLNSKSTAEIGLIERRTLWPVHFCYPAIAKSLLNSGRKGE